MVKGKGRYTIKGEGGKVGNGKVWESGKTRRRGKGIMGW